ncbi:hypothetical protein B0H34DRAFT_707119 [Crassisporium funariophilum]|nr:hypothetical protein B0H34DRAFT_707119 [Crassisporium funariophilum]
MLEYATNGLTILCYILLSLTPLHLQTAFSVIHKSRIADRNQRGRLFEAAMNNLTDWWANSFFEVVPEGHIRSHTFDEVRKGLEIRGLHIQDENDPDAVLDVETLQEIIGDEVEPIRSPKSFMKHALMQNGSRDTSAHLFTALCRGLGIPARLVVSVQSVPWQASIGRPKPKYERKSKGKAKEKVVDDGYNEGEASNTGSMFDSDVQAGVSNGRRLDGVPVPQKSEKAKGKEKAKPLIKLRKTKSKGQVLGGPPSRLASPDPLTTPPVFWTEVFSRPDARWFPVDPIRAIVNQRKVFDPTPTATKINAIAHPGSLFPHPHASNAIPIRRSHDTKIENRLVYVVAFEEDGYARDVTRRYAREFGAKVAKLQGGSNAPNVEGGGKGRRVWWDKVVSAIQRPYRLHRDDQEDQELEAAELSEGMPATMGGFKDHPLYVLTRHLKQTETIHPPPPATIELGKFRGEPVYPRSSVVSLKTAENWMRNSGRIVVAGSQPMKMVKVRAGTVNRMRELEVLKDELRVAGQDGSNGEGSSNTAGEAMQGLYAFSQTEPYVPDPVVNGKVPKNNFGNIDLYVPSMLPRGAVHIPFKRVAKIARKLGFDYAEAVTGFEFKKRRAFPIIEGVVVAAENEAAILEAFWEAEREAEEKARIKREERVIKQWTRLVHGLRIRQRLLEQYGNKANDKKQSHRPQETKEEADDYKDDSREESPPHEKASDGAGGFLAGADKVVQAFHLPKNTHVTLPYTPPPGLSKYADELEEATSEAAPDFITYDLETMDVDPDMEEILTQPPETASTRIFIPKTMQEMAEEATNQRAIDGAVDEEELDMTLPPQADPSAVTAAPKTTLKITLPSKASNSNNASSGGGTPGITKADGKSSRTPRPASRRSKRKRLRKDDREDSDSANSSDEKDDDELQPSPNKRVRVKATPVSTPQSTRTLRPRASRTTAQIESERQNEEAYRRAVAK